MPVCLLVRHGTSTANVTGTLAGWSDGVPLTAYGEEQARAVAELLAGLPLALVATSPLLRCRQTADAIAQARAAASVPADASGKVPADASGKVTAEVTEKAAVDVTVEEGLGECRYGVWTGRSLGDLVADPLWRTVQDVPTQAVFPGSVEYAGESLADMAYRAVSTVRSLDAKVSAADGPDAVWVAVTHGDPIKAVVAEAAGVHLDSFQRFAVEPGSLSAVAYTTGRPMVLALNLVLAPSALAPSALAPNVHGVDVRRFLPARGSGVGAGETAREGRGSSADGREGARSPGDLARKPLA